jgi:tetratricopeptide (TPR) repeat protein
MKKLYALLLATTSLVYSCQNEKPFDENVDRQTYISDKGNCDSMSVNFTNKLAAEYYCKSTEYLEKNDFKNALKWALSAEKSEPNNIMLLKDISLIYSQLNQISVAKLYLKKVFAHYFLNQKDSACHYLKTLIAVDQHGSYNMFKSNFRAMECFE